VRGSYKFFREARGRYRLKVAVALPSTALAEANSLLEKTIKVGFMARALAIYKVEQLVIYRDETEKIDERALLGKLFNYLACPQYLRKKVFPLDPNLRYVGLLPPLNTPNHPIEKSVKDLPKVCYREGLVVDKAAERYLADVGIGASLAFQSSRKLKRGDRVILRIVKRGDEIIEVREVKRDEVPHYFGFVVDVTDLNLKGLISSFKRDALIIATSRYGREVHRELQNLLELMRKYNKLLLIFGSPFRGLYDIARREGFDLDDEVHMTLNFVPSQGTKTVRIEEALYSTLAIINLLRCEVEGVGPSQGNKD
jgi:predicted SPOUT superfamily RNA methylase MTH1